MKLSPCWKQWFTRLTSSNSSATSMKSFVEFLVWWIFWIGFTPLDSTCWRSFPSSRFLVIWRRLLVDYREHGRSDKDKKLVSWKIFVLAYSKTIRHQDVDTGWKIYFFQFSIPNCTLACWHPECHITSTSRLINHQPIQTRVDLRFGCSWRHHKYKIVVLQKVSRKEVKWIIT